MQVTNCCRDTPGLVGKKAWQRHSAPAAAPPTSQQRVRLLLAKRLSANSATCLPPLEQQTATKRKAGSMLVHGVHHVGLLCDNLERSLEFYCGVLDLEINPDRPDDKLPYRGAWLWIGPEMIHLMELPNPDPTDPELRPKHGGRDRHFCIGVDSIDPVEEKLRNAGVEYTRSMSGRAALFFRDPDQNCLEVVELAPWR